MVKARTAIRQSYPETAVAFHFLDVLEMRQGANRDISVSSRRRYPEIFATTADKAKD
jgi:hypothetical protein